MIKLFRLWKVYLRRAYHGDENFCARTPEGRKGRKKARFRVVGVSGGGLKIYAEHFRKKELEQISQETGLTSYGWTPARERATANPRSDPILLVDDGPHVLSLQRLPDVLGVVQGVDDLKLLEALGGAAAA